MTMMAVRAGVRRLARDPYVIFCTLCIAAWLVAWFLAADNLYGWLLDDEETFARFKIYALGGEHFFDIQWFHAYMWILMLLPWQLHWSIPSYTAPRAYDETGQFRALILYTVFLHAVVLGLLATFIRRLCASRIVAATSFLIVVVSPTLTLYTPLLDSRYLGFLAALPALSILLRQAEMRPSGSTTGLVRSYALPGFLFGVAEDIHYECLYLLIPFAVVYWTLIFARDRQAAATRVWFASFVAGLASWIVPVQGLSLIYKPFPDSYIGTLLTHYTRQIPPYSRWEDIVTWFELYHSEMGVPMMFAVVGGAVILATKRWRPPYVRAFNAQLMVGCALFFAVYILASPTYPFYRMSFGIAFFYAIFAAVFIERLSMLVSGLAPKLRTLTASCALIAVLFVPAILRSPEVYVAQQGYGKAVNLAYRLGGTNHVHFIAAFDMDRRPEAIISRADFAALPASDYLVVYFPETFHFKYPDLFALLDNTVPVASYPTLWCTREMWAQVPTFFGGRRWYEEPQNCQAQVFRVSDLRSAQIGPPIDISSVTADSVQSPGLDARRVFAIRTPSMGWMGTELTRQYADLWVSASSEGPHYLDVSLAKPRVIGKITIVPAEFRVPPDFLWRGRMRVENVRIEGADLGQPLRTLWTSSGDLQSRAIFTASFSATRVSRLRFVMWQRHGHNPAVGIKYIDFPGYVERTAWQNVDPPGHPPPGR